MRVSVSSWMSYPNRVFDKPMTMDGVVTGDNFPLVLLPSDDAVPIEEGRYEPTHAYERPVNDGIGLGWADSGCLGGVAGGFVGVHQKVSQLFIFAGTGALGRFRRPERTGIRCGRTTYRRPLPDAGRAIVSGIPAPSRPGCR